MSDPDELVAQSFREMKEQQAAEARLVASLPECCAKCKHFGRQQYSDRSPTGQCQLNPPGKYAVTKESRSFLGGKLFSLKVESVESPFPGVWPWDKCGAFDPAPPAEQKCQHVSLTMADDAGNQQCFGCGKTRMAQPCGICNQHVCECVDRGLR